MTKIESAYVAFEELTEDELLEFVGMLDDTELRILEEVIKFEWDAREAGND